MHQFNNNKITTPFIKEFGIIDNSLQNDIIEYIKQYKGEFQSSKLYSSTQDKKFIDLDERKSNFREITDVKLFNLIDLYIEKLNKIDFDKSHDYALVKNNITHIKYQSGDFFNKHNDYLSLTTNIIEEYTGIMCIDAKCKGGETIFHLNDYKHVSKSSITPKHSIIFRKDLNHEGNIVDGYKEIITFNLWAIPKKTGKIIIITFNSSAVHNDHYYIIPYETH